MSQSRQFTGTLRDINRSFLPPERSNTAPTHFVFVLLENYSLLSFTSAVDALVTANLVSSSERFKFTTVGVCSHEVTSDLGINTSADRTLDELSHNEEIDFMVICGGFRSQLEGVPKLTPKLRQIAARKTRLGGIWNGVLLLAHAGVIKEAKYALHLDNHAYAKEHFPGSNLSDLAYVVTDKVVSAAGPSSALEMMLKLIEELQGIEIVDAVKEILSCDRSAEPTQMPKFRDVFLPSTPQTLKDTIQLMVNHMEEPMAIDQLANRIGSSRRKLERLFRIHLQTSPSRYYLELRLTHARQLLLQSNDSIATLSEATGFSSPSYFNRCFKEYFSVSPLELKKHRLNISRLRQERVI